jgi:hypothetical protein
MQILPTRTAPNKFLANKFILLSWLIHAHSQLDPELVYGGAVQSSHHPNLTTSYRTSEPLRTDMELGQVPEWLLCKNLSESINGFL